MKTILHTESSMGFGGQEIRILRECEQMKKRGYRMLIICQPGSGLSQQAKKTDFILEEVCMRNSFDPKALWQIYQIVKKYEVTLINTHSSKDSWLASIVGRLLRIPIIRTRHVSIGVKKNFFSEFVYKNLCDFIMTTGDAILKSLVEDNGVAAVKLMSVPTGIDMELFKKIEPLDSIRTEFNIGKEDLVVGMLGFIRSEKGHTYLLDAVPAILQEMPNVKFLIVGHEPMGSKIRDRVSNSDLKNVVTITGFRQDVVDICSVVDVIVQPSTGKEGVPQSLIQALAMEKACIGTKAGAISELIIENETGFFIPMHDAASIAQKVVFLLKNKELRSQFGKAGRKLVQETFAITKMGDKIEEIYGKLLEK